MTPPERDRWSPFDPVRLCLLRQPDLAKPAQALLLDTKMVDQRTLYLVVSMDERPDHGAQMTWVPRSDLRPISIDPNTLQVYGYRRS